ncbi:MULTISPECIES: bifunctional 3-phenylpropionate/cinnamic acid dioxygenase ferredoxin subunit [unclassified Streptomyces]|uniref:bifunctional 3-phenylpropionate/cinnamic acid dioxygenase ferredoxin subunit n=1 Tax=unclassified Streptomyces TaxID=2593676 RepID=UPI0038057801
MIPVCRIEDLPEGESVRIEIDDTTPAIAVFHAEGGGFYALDDTCSHQDASLSEGFVEGCFVECPLHAALFDLRTGAPTCLPARRAVRTHEVDVLDGMIHVRPAVREEAVA